MKKNKIVEFLRSHPLISIYGLEKQIKISEGTIAKAVKGDRSLPDKYNELIEPVLKEYGYK